MSTHTVSAIHPLFVLSVGPEDHMGAVKKLQEDSRSSAKVIHPHKVYIG